VQKQCFKMLLALELVMLLYPRRLTIIDSSIVRQ
jgi:hypothetical protein